MKSYPLKSPFSLLFTIPPPQEHYSRTHAIVHNLPCAYICIYRKNNVQFATVITRLQESPQCQRLPFMSFLLLPFQRITRIKMLIEVSSIMGLVVK